ncbi:hypothetical protein RJT34_05266 [Clitoria ternatea]|uniref:Uncharacterized protein n=1 Tax=Clitoria ternatea TaxID=43366 RepID=A0AAN9K0W5_CLITE
MEIPKLDSWKCNGSSGERFYVGVEFNVLVWSEGEGVVVHGNVCGQCVKGPHLVFIVLLSFTLLSVVEYGIGESVSVFIHFISPKLCLLSLEEVFFSAIKASILDAFFCLYLGWIGNRGWPKGLLIFPKVARSQTCHSKDKHCPQICPLVGVSEKSKKAP